MLGVVTKKTTLRRLERGIFLSQVARYVIVLEFSKWLNENSGKVSPKPGSTFSGSTFQPTKTPASSSDLDDFDLEPTPEVDKNTLIKAGDNFLKELDLKITRMIGKTLNAYENKNSDAFSRAAITLEKYHEELKNRYSNWMNKLISKANKAPSPPPMNFNEADQRYSLGAYAQQMYMVAKKIWEDWIHTFLIEKDPALKSAKEWFAINSGYKVKVPQYKKVERLADGSLDLSQFIKLISNSRLGDIYKSNAKVKEQVDRINDLPPEEYKELLAKTLQKLDDPQTEELVQNYFDRQFDKIEASGKLPNLLKEIQRYKAWILGGIVATVSGTGIAIISAILLTAPLGAAIAVTAGIATAGGGLGSVAGSAIEGIDQYRQQRKRLASEEEKAKEMAKDSEDALKKHIAEKFLEKMVGYINEIGKEVASKYMGSVK